MKELSKFREFLNEDLDEGMFDKFKKELGDVIKTYKELEKAATSGDGGGIFGGGSEEAVRAAKDRQLKADAKKAGVDFKMEENDKVLDEVIGEATKPDEKEIKAAAAKLMKDPKFKAQYKGKKGVDFVKHAMAVAKKSMKKSK